MTEKLTDRSESDRQKIIPEWRVSADDQIVLVAFVALLFIIGALAWNAWASGGDGTPAALDDIVGSEHEREALVNDVDLSSVESRYDIDGRMRGREALLTGTVATEADRMAAEAAALALDGVDRVDNRLQLAENTEGNEADDADTGVVSEVTTTTTEPPTTTTAGPVTAEAMVAVSDQGIALTGMAPDEQTAEALRAAALESFAAEQVDDQLGVAENATSFELSVTGTVGDPEVLDNLSSSLQALGADQLDNELMLDAASAVSSALNELFELEPVLFESGTDVVLAESLPTLDRAAELLAENPDVSIQVGGHTDSRGDAAANLALSQARADAVAAALIERGVVNELTAVGFGETQLLVDPDDTPEAQQANRRIEFTPA